MSLKYYNNYLNHIYKNPKDEWQTRQQAFVNNNYDNTTIATENLYQENIPFDFNFIQNPKAWIGTVLDITTGMIRKSDDYRSVYFKDLKHDAPRGLYFKWNTNYWMVYESVTNLETISTCNIRRCNNWLKWITDKGEVYAYPCIVDDDLSSNSPQVAKVITQANSHLVVYVQNNKNTRTIVKNQRFVLNGCVYKLSADYIYNNLDYLSHDNDIIQLQLYLDMLQPTDNLDIQLADDTRDKYTLTLSNKDLIMRPNDIIKLNVRAYYNQDIEVNSILEYTSLNKNICSVTQDGYCQAVSNGTTYIVVKIKGNNKSMQRIKCVVSDVINLTYNIDTTNVKQLKQYYDVEFKACIMDNQGNVHDDNIVLTYDTSDKRCTVTQTGVNTWLLCNQTVDKRNPFILHLSSKGYNLTKDIALELVASF